MPLRGSKLAYYLKRTNPELYEKARRIKEHYNLTWDTAIAIARGEAPLPAPSKLEDIVRALEELRARIESIERELGKLGGLEGRVKELEGTAREIYTSLSLRFLRRYQCKYIDRDGYCTEWEWRERVEDWLMREEVVEGRKVYKVNVLKHKWLCALCPLYTPSLRSLIA